MCPEIILDQLSWDQKIIAERLVTIFNDLISQKKIVHLERKIKYTPNAVSTEFYDKWISLNPTTSRIYMSTQVREAEKYVLDLFMKEGIIFGYHDLEGSHGRIVYC